MPDDMEKRIRRLEIVTIRNEQLAKCKRLSRLERTRRYSRCAKILTGATQVAQDDCAEYEAAVEMFSLILSDIDDEMQQKGCPSSGHPDCPGLSQDWGNVAALLDDAIQSCLQNNCGCAV